MLNRIRRAVSLTRARYFPKGRHRRPLTPSLARAVLTRPAPAVGPAAVPERTPDPSNRAHPLAGEDNALVRPYVLAWEKHTRQRPVVVAPHLSADAWSALAGVR